MERILWLYRLPYDPLYPVVCFDERPCFLIGDKVEPIALQQGQVRYTPKAASWLNMIEFSALARLCPGALGARRIPTQAQLEAELLALIAARDRKRIQIDWQFSIQTARTKLNSHYQRTHAANEKFQKI